MFAFESLFSLSVDDGYRNAILGTAGDVVMLALEVRANPTKTKECIPFYA